MAAGLDSKINLKLRSLSRMRSSINLRSVMSRTETQTQDPRPLKLGKVDKEVSIGNSDRSFLAPFASIKVSDFKKV